MSRSGQRKPGSTLSEPLAWHEGDVRRAHGVGVTLDLEAGILREDFTQSRCSTNAPTRSVSRAEQAP